MLQDHEVLDPACQGATVEDHVCSVMNWGAISWEVQEYLVLAPTFFIAIRCEEVLGVPPLPFMYSCLPQGNGVLQQNNCSSRRSRWLDEYFSNLSVIMWPPRTPYLNPIEHLSDALEKEVKAHHTTPAIIIKLLIVLVDTRQAMPVEHFLIRVESMPRRFGSHYQVQSRLNLLLTCYP